MKPKELTKTFMMNTNWKKLFSLHGLYKHISALKVVKLDTPDL